jgi:hypothetical protein
MVFKNTVMKSLFILVLMSYTYAYPTPVTKQITNYIYEIGDPTQEDYAILIFEKPYYSDETASRGLTVSLAGFSFVELILYFILQVKEDAFKLNIAKIGIYGTLLSVIIGLMLNIGHLKSTIKTKLWGHMIALTNKGIFHWKHGSRYWQDITSIEKSDVLYLKTRNQKTIEERIQHPSIPIPLQNIPMEPKAFEETVKDLWDKNKNKNRKIEKNKDVYPPTGALAWFKNQLQRATRFALHSKSTSAL